MIVRSAASAAIAPMAAHTGSSSMPTTPMVSGISISVLPSSFLIVSRRMLPSWSSWRIAPTSASPVTLTSSRCTFSSLMVFPFHILVWDIHHQYAAAQRKSRTRKSLF